MKVTKKIGAKESQMHCPEGVCFHAGHGGDFPLRPAVAEMFDGLGTALKCERHKHLV